MKIDGRLDSSSILLHTELKPTFPLDATPGDVFLLPINNSFQIYVFKEDLTWKNISQPREEYNAVFTFDTVTQLITTEKAFQPRSTRLFLGGQRLALDVDYIEVGSTQLLLLYTVTQEEIMAGSNFVLDFQLKANS